MDTSPVTSYDLTVDAHTGSARLRVPVQTSPGRGDFGPKLALNYASGAGNSMAGAGWSLEGIPFVGVDITEAAPRYDGTDLFSFNGHDRLVPELKGDGSPRTVNVSGETVEFFRPRRGYGAVRVERWTDAAGRVHWRTRDRSDRLTIYGRSPSHRIADPADPSRIFRWLAEAQYDGLGNAISFEYAAEDAAGVDALAGESDRVARGLFAQRYLKRIRYGNETPLQPADDLAAAKWHFEVVFDFGDHAADARSAADRPWPVRSDPHSSYRAGFEIRTYRLLHRILMFHRFDALGAQPVLVGETVLTHDHQSAGSLLQSVGYTGHRVDGAARRSRSKPDVTFSYAVPERGEAFEQAGSSGTVPSAIGGRHRWTDLYGDGIPGLLTDAGGAWYFQRNLGGGHFGMHEAVALRPALGLADGEVSDFDRDGNTNLGVLTGRSAGYYEYDRNGRAWASFRTLLSSPHAGGRTQWVDLNADGRPDIVVAHEDHLTWYASLGADGFAEPVDIPLPGDAPSPVVAGDPSLRFHFADCSGDGLPDLVYVRNGGLEYWPNLGNGLFGPRVVMEGAPVFDHDEMFDPRRLRFVDLDGSGTSDLIYVGRGEVRFWTNASGNALVESGRLACPAIDDVASVQILELLADKTPHLVWSSSLPGDDAAPVRYLPLTGRVHPRLLLAVSNGVGGESVLTYGTSAAHYLRDLSEDRPWRTVLPSHVTVVDRLETIDHVGGGRTVTRYAYHDGHFDGEERAFRGFSLVEQYDAETHPGSVPENYVAPSLTRTWFHDGRSATGRPQDDVFEGDPAGRAVEPSRPESPAELDDEAFENAYRALAGLVLRQEVYETDRFGEPAGVPVEVVQNAYRARRLQPEGDAEAVFAAYRTERLSADYQGGDPREAHHLTLEVDAYGEILLEAEVAYGRRGSPPIAGQRESFMSLSRQAFTHVDTAERYAIAVPTESEEFEILGRTIAAAEILRVDALAAELAPVLASPLEFDEPHAAGPAVRRLEWERCTYWNDALDAALPVGQIGGRTIVHHEETATLTPDVVTAAFGGDVDAAMLQSAGYVLDGGYWWAPGPVYHHRGTAGFFTPSETEAPLGGTTKFVFDDAFLMHRQVTDPVGNVATTEIDYYALAQSRTTDPNGTVTEVRLDPLGLVEATFARGTLRASDGTDHPYGSGLRADYTDPGPLTLGSILADPAAALQGAMQFSFVDLEAWTRDGTPNASVTLLRSTHVHDGTGAAAQLGGPIEIAVAYVDGFGRTLQQKQRVDAGPAVQVAADGTVTVDASGLPVLADVPERWLVSGHTLYSNKHQPVRQYEPFYSPRVDFDTGLQRYGAAAETHYDAIGRIVRVDSPDGTFTRVERTAWEQAAYDANDTVDASAYRLAREILPAGDPERLALEGAMLHADTPTRTHFDALGRELLLVEEGAVERRTLATFDGAGRLREVTDPRGLRAFAYVYDMQGGALRTESVDAGVSRTLVDVEGRPVHDWDARGVHLRTAYDDVSRPVTVTGGASSVLQRWEYGESLPDAVSRNARGRVTKAYDGSGVVETEAYLPTGEAARQTRRFAADFKAEPDWSDVTAVSLETDVFRTAATFDALARVTRLSAADGSHRAVGYRPGGALASLHYTSAGGTLSDVPIVERIAYNARGQKRQTTLGNGVKLDVEYDPNTFRMTRVRARGLGREYQDLFYTYDPVGNVVRVVDGAQEPTAPSPHVLQGLSVSSEARYEYDAFYQLARATGRVHQALQEHDYRGDLPHPDAVKGTRHLSLNNGAAVERYERTYAYDAGGNIEEVKHLATTRQWTRTHWISLTSNRSLPENDLNGVPIAHPESRFDAAGHCTQLPHVRRFEWNSHGHLRTAVIIERSGQADDAEYYVYDATGLRRRKVTERLSSGLVEATEKLYLDGCEITRIRRGGHLILERHSSMLEDGVTKVATVHRWTRDDHARETDDVTRIKTHYALSSHQGSAVMELDAAGAVITYEEYFPYGGSAFIAGSDLRDVKLRDYRYSGKERDDATGLYYYGYRYYAPFIGNWLSPDPAGPTDGLNLYRFVHGNPVSLTDVNGLQSDVTLLASGPRGMTEDEAIIYYNREYAFERGHRITDLDPSEEDPDIWVVKSFRPLTEREIESLQRIADIGDSDVIDALLVLDQAVAEILEGPSLEDLINGAGGEDEEGDDPPPPEDGDEHGEDALDAEGDGPGLGLEGEGEGGGGDSETSNGLAETGEGPGAEGPDRSGRRNGRGNGTRNGSQDDATRRRGDGSKDGEEGGVEGGVKGGVEGGSPDAPPNAPPVPDDYRPPPPGTLPGGTDPDGSPRGSLDGSPDGTREDPNGEAGDDGTPGTGQGGGEQAQGEQQQGGDGEASGTPRTRERDWLDSAVDVASYITLDAFFQDENQEGGDENGIPGGLGLFNLDLGRWGQGLYVGAAVVDLIATIITLGELKAASIAARQALRRGMSQLRRLAPLAKQVIKEAGTRAADAVRRGYRRVMERINPTVPFYHGTSIPYAAQIRAQGIDILRSRFGTDFGRGFYLAPTREGAIASASRLYGAAVDVVEFRVPRRQLRRLSELVFDGPTPDWQDFVRFHRGEFNILGRPGQPPRLLEHGGQLYDMVTGPLFARVRRSGEILPLPDLRQSSIHTQRAIDLFNRYIIQ